MLTPPGLVSWLRGSGRGVAEQMQRSVRVISRCLGLCLVAAFAALGVAVMGMAGDLLLALLAIDAVAIVTLTILLIAARAAVTDAAVRPLAELALAASRLEGGDTGGQAPSGSREVEQISGTLALLARRLVEERSTRASEQTAGWEQASGLRQLLRVIQLVGGSLDTRHILRALADGAREIGGYREASVWFVDEIDHRLTLAYSTAAPDGPTAGVGSALPLSDAGAGRAATSVQTVRLRADDRGGAGIAIPMARGLSVVGVLELRGEDAGRPVIADPSGAIEALETMAGHAAMAIAASRLHQEAELRSETDPLTRLFNRRKLDGDIKGEVARSLRYGHPLALIMVDVDHFKSINDTFGHQQGDEVLKAVAATLARHSREIDSAYRFGGEEFAVLLRETDVRSAHEVAERLRVRVSDAVKQLGLPRDVTASLGVAAICSSIQTADRLIEAADGALYEAKQGGRNRVIISALVEKV